MFMLQPGMGVRLGTYYRRRGDDDNGHAAISAELRAARAEGQVRRAPPPWHAAAAVSLQTGFRRRLALVRACAPGGCWPRRRQFGCGLRTPSSARTETRRPPRFFPRQVLPPTSAEPPPPGAPRPPWMIGTAHTLDPDAPSPFLDLGQIAPGTAQFAVDAGCYRCAGSVVSVGATGAGRGAAP